MDDRLGFIEWLQGDIPGYTSIGVKTATSNHWIEQSFISDDREAIVEYIGRHQHNGNLYFCPTRLSASSRLKTNIVYGHCLWADLDEFHPDSLLVKPSIVVETSPNRYQAYWKLDRVYHSSDIEEYNRRIAYKHESDGCDISGWDLTQMMRIPSTTNFKYSPDFYKVRIADLDIERTYALEVFDEFYPEVERFKELKAAPLPLSENLPNRSGAELLEELSTSVHPRVWSLFKDTPLTDWSKNIWNLQLMLFEIGVPRETVFVIARDAACNKFNRDGHDLTILWREVLRAEASIKSPNTVKITGNERVVIPDKDLLTEDERLQAKVDITIIDDFVNYGKLVCDAPPQYHIAGAFIILTNLLAGSIRLPTSFANLIPNLWFMILADTTLTRKSTAMDLAVDMLVDIDASAVLATDGTAEGILKSMSTRPGMPSMFVKDEFSGLLEAMSKKDYMAGMLEGLTKLYDGKLMKRTLAKDIIEVKDPVFILFAGGIRARILSLLTHQHINSGFLPRFCLVTAEADFNRIKPLGPPTALTSNNRVELLDRFKTIKVCNTPTISSSVLFDNQYKEAELTPEAWKRFNIIDEIMQNIGFHSSMDDLLTPMMARLAISGLKAAVLIAASRLELPDQALIVQERDIVKAFSYVEHWKAHAIQVVMNAGQTQMEKHMEKVYKAVVDSGLDGASRSVLMNQHKMTARDADNTFATLEQRGLITKFKRNGGVFYIQKDHVV